MTNDATLRPTRRPDVEAVDIDGELVLWDPVGRGVHRLDPVGSLLWPFLDGSATIGELAADASEVWEVPRKNAESALVALVEQLETAGLLLDPASPVRVASASPSYLVDPPSP